MAQNTFPRKFCPPPKGPITVHPSLKIETKPSIPPATYPKENLIRLTLPRSVSVVSTGSSQGQIIIASSASSSLTKPGVVRVVPSLGKMPEISLLKSSSSSAESMPKIVAATGNYKLTTTSKSMAVGQGGILNAQHLQPIANELQVPLSKSSEHVTQFTSRSDSNKSSAIENSNEQADKSSIADEKYKVFPDVEFLDLSKMGSNPSNDTFEIINHGEVIFVNGMAFLTRDGITFVDCPYCKVPTPLVTLGSHIECDHKRGIVDCFIEGCKARSLVTCKLYTHLLHSHWLLTCPSCRKLVFVHDLYRHDVANCPGPSDKSKVPMSLEVNDYKDLSSAGLEQKRWCMRCDQFFSEDTNVHMRSKHETNFMCSICKKCIPKNDYREHVTNHESKLDESIQD